MTHLNHLNIEKKYDINKVGSQQWNRALKKRERREEEER